MPPRRFQAAFIVWLQRQMPPTEEGQAQWESLVQWLNAPPVDRASLAVRSRPRVRPAALPAGAPVTPSQQASAFAAFQGTTLTGG